MRDPNMAAKNPALPDDEVDELRAVEMSAHITTRHTPTMSEMRRMRGALVKKGAISLSIPRLAGRYGRKYHTGIPQTFNHAGGWSSSRVRFNDVACRISSWGCKISELACKSIDC